MAHADRASGLADGTFRPGTVRGVDGFFRAAQDGNGRWWLIDGRDEAVFVRAVHGVRAAGPQGDGPLPLDAAGRLRSWGFNAVGLGNDGAGREDGLPFMSAVGFCRAGQEINLGNARLPDVFDPEWPRWVARRAETICAPERDNPQRIGWVTDDGLSWAHPSAAGRPSLLQICLSLEPSFAAYHAAWEFVLALHGGRLEILTRAWGAAVKNKEILRELTRADVGLGARGYLRDEARWEREFARRYVTVTSAAVRAVDPNHLILGCRFSGLAGPAVLGECVYPTIDVAMPNWAELPAAGSSPSHPVLAGDVSPMAEEFLRPPVGKKGRLTTVERMLRRERAALERMARHPAVAGYVWSRWQDEAGEQPPFGRGLLHVNGAEAREHTEVLAPFNLRVEALRESTV